MSYNVSHAQGQLLAQIRPADTNPTLFYESQELRTEITLIITSLTNTAATNVDVAFYHDDENVGFSDDNLVALLQLPTSKDASWSTLFQAQHPGSGILVKPGGRIGVQTDSANDVVFTCYGITETLAERVRSGSGGDR